MKVYTVALFGEAEKGDYQTAYHCQSLPQLADYLGNPPKESHGLFFAVQALLFRRDLIFFRVQEEGFSIQDYMLGLNILKKSNLVDQLAAICLPGVGNEEIIGESTSICQQLHSILITTERDLYDYLTEMSLF